MAKLWVALLLLLSTLSSQPLGSMEQSAPEPGRRLADAPALPLGRALDGAALPEARPDPLPRPHDAQLAAPTGAAASLASVRTVPAGFPAPAPPRRAASLLERLPYHATAPPPPPAR